MRRRMLGPTSRARKAFGWSVSRERQKRPAGPPAGLGEINTVNKERKKKGRRKNKSSTLRVCVCLLCEKSIRDAQVVCVIDGCSSLARVGFLNLQNGWPARGFASQRASQPAYFLLLLLHTRPRGMKEILSCSCSMSCRTLVCLLIAESLARTRSNSCKRGSGLQTSSSLWPWPQPLSL